MRGGSRCSYPSHRPVSMDFANGMSSGGSPRVHETQHFRANLRISHPPTMFLDDSILSSGLEGFEEQEQEQPEQSPQMLPDPVSPWKENQGPHGVPELNDGVISPLELPPRLVNFGTADEVDSTLFKLDPKELDRRLQSVARAESIFRLERLSKANMLDDFFARLRGMRI